jgi:lipoprotein
MKLITSILASVGALVASIGTVGCPALICDEPKMPKSLLNK